jgi:ATP-binding cassette, subfamily B, bacterial MsbA
MVEEINFNRNTSVDEENIKFYKSSKKVFNIFNNRSWILLFSFLKRLKINLFIVTIISISIGLIEGIKAGAIILFITITLADNSELEKYKESEYFSWFFDINYNYFLLDLRLFLIYSVLFALVFLTIINSSAKVYVAWLNQKITTKLLRIVREAVLNKLFSFDIKYFSQAKSGELLFLMTAETSRFSSIINIFVVSISLLTQFFIFYIMLMYMLWQFTLIISFIGLIYFLLHIRIDKKLKILSWTQNLSLNNLSQFFHQTIYGIKIIKISGLEKRQTLKYLNQHKDFENTSIMQGLYGGVSKAFQEIFLFLTLGFIIFILIYFYGFDYIINNSQVYLAFLFLLLRSLPVLLQLQTARNNLINSYGPLSRVMDLISTNKSEVIKKNHHEKKEIDISKIEIDNIKIENINFSYDDKKILNTINHTFNKNKLIAIVGQSGSGKSTLLDIIANLLIPQSGSMLINNEKIININNSSFQNILGYMNQEPIIFHDTIRNNVDFIKQNSKSDEIWRSIKLSGSFDFVNELENKIDHGLGERGQTLSGGQKQRLGIARLFLQNPKLILLDEGTNALDFKTEKIIYDNFKKIAQNKIIIIVAHRLSALINFDQIVVLNSGKIAEVGNHNELISRKGLYYDMFNAQIKMEDFRLKE